MKLRDVLITILGAMGGSIDSKTKIQKLRHLFHQTNLFGPFLLFQIQTFAPAR